MSAKRSVRPRPKAIRRRPASDWLLPGALLLLTLAIASGLWAYRLHSTAIEFDGVTTDLEFQVKDEQPVTQPLALRSLGIAGAAAIDLPPDLTGVGGDPGSGLQLSLAEPGNGSITLARISVPAGTRIAIREHEPLGMRMVIDGPDGHDIRVEATIEGELTIGQADGQAAPLSVAAPKLVSAILSGDPAELDFTLQSPAERALATSLEVQSLGFSRTEEAGSDLAGQRVSGLKSGELILHDLASRVTPVRSGNDLSLWLDQGELRNVGFSADGIRLNFAGTVREMQGGSERRPVKLMPTALEWLMANQKLVLIWTAVAYLFGIGLAMRRWWEGKEP